MMDYQDFKPGKKYRFMDWRQGTYLVCVGHTLNGVPVMESPDGKFFRVTAYNSWQDFVEIREGQEFWIDAVSWVVYTKNMPGHKMIHVKEVLE